MRPKIDQARDAVADAAAQLASEIQDGKAPHRGRCEGLQLAAQAVERVAFGPQGGDKNIDDKTEYTYTYHYPGGRKAGFN